MNALLLTVFVSAVLMAYGLVQFFAAWSRGEHQQADRLALLPLEDAPSVPSRPAGGDAVEDAARNAASNAVADGGEEE